MTSDNITSMQDAAASTRAIDGTNCPACADMAALSRGSIGAALASGQAAICGMQEVTATLLAFLQSRVKDGLAASQQLAACDSPEALIEVQLECAKATLQAYADEFGRLHALTGKILADVLVPVRSRAAVGRKTAAEAGADALAA
jgi:hypothetical protein